MFIGEVLRFVIVDFVLNILYFPVWWYTTGTMKVARLISKEVRSLAQSLNIAILFRFLLQPMFGQTDIWGRIISFFVRIVHFVILVTISLLATITWSIVLIIWVLLPVVIVGNIVFHFQGIFINCCDV